MDANNLFHCLENLRPHSSYPLSLHTIEKHEAIETLLCQPKYGTLGQNRQLYAGLIPFY